MTKTAAEIWRYFEIEGMPSSGAHKPIKQDIIDWGAWLESRSAGAIVVNTADYNVNSTNTAAVNLAGFKAAVAAVEPGGILYMPPESGAVASFDTSGGLAAAIPIDKPMMLIINGHMKTTHSAIGANPSYLFNVTGNDVMFTGNGTLEGDGTMTVASGAGDSTQYPGLIRVLGAANFRFRDLTIYRHPQHGIYLVNCTRAIIGPCEMQGGPASFQPSYVPPDYTTPNPSYVGSYYCGVTATGGADHLFTGVRFTKDAAGGRTAIGIFTAGNSGIAHGCKTVNCIAYEPWEKLIYGYGDRQVVMGNTCTGAADSAHTDAYRIWGSNCVVVGNISDGCKDACQVLDGRQNIIAGNQFMNCRKTGINVEDFSSTYTLGISLTIVADNLITWDGLTASPRFAIRIGGSNRGDVSGVRVTGNVCNGWGQLAGSSTIELVATTPCNANKCVIEGNVVIGAGAGIRITRSVGGVIRNNDFYAGTGVAIHLEAGAENEVAGNTGKNPGSWFLSLNASSGNRFINNRSQGATNIGIQGHIFGANSNYAEGNSWGTLPLIAETTLGTGSYITTVTHGGVAPHASIAFWPVNAGFAIKNAADGYNTAVSGTNFTIANGNGNVAAGTETFRYQIIQ